MSRLTLPVLAGSAQRALIITSILITIGCASISGSQWDQRYGKAVPREVASSPQQATHSYYGNTKTIIEQRCVVCHGCYDAPCQLKLESYEGLLRGANPAKVYDGTRFLGSSLTRLFEDAQTTAEWRTKGFHPVINERGNSASANINASVMAQQLLLKQEHPLPTDAILSDTFNLDINSAQYCASIENLEPYTRKNPLAGMPYGLPGLNEQEHKITMEWLKQGAAMGKAPILPTQIHTEVAQWEAFLNGDSLKAQLVNRYIYEHLFLAQIDFTAAPGVYFRLVRSSTPPGEPLARISTSRPFDDPGVTRVYYRLWQDPSSVTAKTHMPYRLDKAREQQWQSLFYAPDYEVTQLPGYSSEIASNPFVVFAELPINARYRFMLNEARFTIMNFIKGPVCRGQVALNVIQDHFWVFFYSPESQATPGDTRFLVENSKHLQLPASAGNTLLPLTNWLKYSELQKEYLTAKAKFVSEKMAAEGGLEMHSIWDGDKGTNDNAALTIFRHADSASVHKGMIGQSPKTAWVIGYPLLERIHYLLVAGFDVYGNVSHQLLSRLYMDFLRIEGEMNFVELLPHDSQQPTLQYWYRNAESNLQTYIDIYLNQADTPNNIKYDTESHQEELYLKLKRHLGKAGQSHHNLNTAKLSPHKLALYQELQNTSGKAISFLPQTTLIELRGVGLFSLVHNSAYSNLSSLFGEDKRRIPAEDNLTLTRGVIGAYPNSFLRVEPGELEEFIEHLQQLGSEQDYLSLKARFGIRRTSPEFWAFSDRVHQLYKTAEPGEAALLDYNRLENR
jgi:hypothetical protein